MEASIGEILDVDGMAREASQCRISDDTLLVVHRDSAPSPDTACSGEEGVMDVDLPEAVEEKEEPASGSVVEVAPPTTTMATTSTATARRAVVGNSGTCSKIVLSEEEEEEKEEEEELPPAPADMSKVDGYVTFFSSRDMMTLMFWDLFLE